MAETIKQGYLGAVMDISTDDKFYRTPSVDKKGYTLRDPLNPINTVTARESAVFNGNFVSDFLEQTYRGLVPRVPRTIGAIAQLEGELVKSRGFIGQAFDVARLTQRVFTPGVLNLPGTTAQESLLLQAENLIRGALPGKPEEQRDTERIYGERLINFGLYMADVADDMIRTREETHPVLNKTSMFLGDVTSSLLVSIALASIGGPAFAGIVLGAESGLNIAKEALDAGNDINTAITWGAFTGVAISELEKFGLQQVIGKSMGRGIGVVSQYIMNAVLSEGVTEALQTTLELGVGITTGAQQNLTIQSFLSQVIYSAAVGAFAGGGMVSAVAIPQRIRAIRTMQNSLGLDKGSATELVDGAMQQAQTTLLEDMGGEVQFTDIINRTYQTIRDVVNLATSGNAVTKAQADLAIEQHLGTAPITAMLKEMGAIAQADIQGEIDAGEVKGRRVKGKRAAQIAQEAITEKPEAEILPPFEPIVAQIDPKMGIEFKLAVQGRLKFIKDRAKQIRKELLDTARIINAKGISIEKGQLPNRQRKLSEEYANLIFEYSAISQDPNAIHQEKKGKITTTSEVFRRLSLHKIKTVISQVRKNFLLGRKAIQSELNYVKGVMTGLINQPGVTQTQRQQLKGLMSSIRTPVQLEKRIGEIETRIQQMLENNYISAFKISIDSSISIMKGQRVGTRRKVSLPADQQVFADTFLKALKQVDIDAGEEVNNIGTPTGLMRTMAAMLVTGKNVHGQDLDATNYAWIERTLRGFVETESLAQIKARKAKSRAEKELHSRILSELEKGKVERTTLVGQGLEKLLNETIKLGGNYDVMVGALVKGLGLQADSTAFRAAMDAFPGLRIAETYRAYFDSRFQEGAKNIFGLKSTLQLNEKLVRDSIEMITLLDDEANVIWDKSRAITREKYMLWLSPEGQIILKNEAWTDEFAEKIMNTLTTEDIQFINLQLGIYSEMYTQTNEVFRKERGYDLPRREQYSSVYRKDFDLDNQDVSELITGRKINTETGDVRYLRPLTRSKLPLLDITDFNKMNRYIRDVSYYMGMSETANRIQRILNNSDIKNQVEESIDKSFYKNLKRFSNVLVRNTAFTDASDLHGTFNKAVTNFNKMVLAAKPVLFAKQLVSSFAALDQVPVVDYFKSVTDLPKALADGRLDKLLNNPFFAARGMRRSISRDLREITEEFNQRIGFEKNEKKAIRNVKLNHYMFMMTQLGDMGGVITNGWVVYQHNLKTMSEAEAITNAIRHINKSQQSADYTEMSTFALKTDPFSRSLTAFTHAPMQYVSKILEQLNTVGTEAFNAKKFVRIYAIYGVLLNVLFNAIGRGFRWEKKDRPEYIAEAAIGPFDRLYIMGPILRWAVANATFIIDKRITKDEDIKKPISASLRKAQFGTFMSMYRNIADAERALTEVFEEGITVEEFFGAITQLSEAFGPVAGVYAGLGRAVGGAGQGIAAAVEANGQGSFVNSWRRLLMVVGYSEFATRPKEE